MPTRSASPATTHSTSVAGEAAAGGLDNNGGGGGGRILILANTYTASGTGIFNLAGGPGTGLYGDAGGSGVLTIVPEPSSLVLLAMVLPIVAYSLRRRARVPMKHRQPATSTSGGNGLSTSAWNTAYTQL